MRTRFTYPRLKMKCLILYDKNIPSKSESLRSSSFNTDEKLNALFIFKSSKISIRRKRD